MKKTIICDCGAEYDGKKDACPGCGRHNSIVFLCRKCGAYKPSVYAYEGNLPESKCMFCKGNAVNTGLTKINYDNMNGPEKEAFFSTLVFEVESPAAAEETKSTQEIKCSTCGKSIPNYSHYCLWCGAEVIKPNTCRNCKKTIPEDSAFCPFCGNKVE